MNTEFAPVASPTKRRLVRRGILAVFVLLLLIGGGAYVASRLGLDKALVTQQLDAWIARAEEKATQEGMQLDIAYDSVSLAGGFTDRHAVIRNLRATVSSEGMPGVPVETRTYRTAEVQFFPRSRDLQDFSLRLPAPIDMLENDAQDPAFSLVSDTPLEFTLERVSRADGLYHQFTHPLPAQVTLRYLAGHDARGEEEETPTLSPRYDAITIAQQGGMFRYLAHDEDAALGTTEFQAENIRIVPVGREQETVTIAQLLLNYSNEINAEKKNDIRFDFALKELAASAEYLPHNPFSATLQFMFEGVLPETPEQLAGASDHTSAFKLASFSVHTQTAKIDATADFTTQKDDILPVGTATVTFTDVPAWRKLLADSSLIHPTSEELLNTILLRTVGTRLVDATDVTLNITRVRGGAFEVGDSTFEEVLAIVMGNMKTPLDAPAPAPQADPQAVPQAAAEEKTPPVSPKESAPEAASQPAPEAAKTQASDAQAEPAGTANEATGKAAE
jgi:hypothetical protein